MNRYKFQIRPMRAHRTTPELSKQALRVWYQSAPCDANLAKACSSDRETRESCRWLGVYTPPADGQPAGGRCRVDFELSRALHTDSLSLDARSLNKRLLHAASSGTAEVVRLLLELPPERGVIRI